MKPVIPPEKATAAVIQGCYSIFSYAVNAGILRAAAKCESCPETDSLSGHHDDYSLPLSVRWLCGRCHYEAHAKQRLLETRKRALALFGVKLESGLTARQKEVLDFFHSFFKRRKTTPTIREIGVALNIRSPNGVMCHVTALVKKGWLKPHPNESRGYRLVDVHGKEKAVPA